MSTETPVTPLSIPAASITALHEAGDEPITEYVAAIAAPAVAAELRRLADDLAAKNTGGGKAGKPYREAFAVAIAGLRVRADELDPPA